MNDHTTYFVIVNRAEGLAYILDAYPAERAALGAEFGELVLGEFTTPADAVAAVMAALNDPPH